MYKLLSEVNKIVEKGNRANLNNSTENPASICPSI